MYFVVSHWQLPSADWINELADMFRVGSSLQKTQTSLVERRWRIPLKINQLLCTKLSSISTALYESRYNYYVCTALVLPTR